MMQPTQTAVRDLRAAEPAMASDGAALIGSAIADRYRLLALIGEGGLGYVFRAQHLVTHKTVALKILRPELAELHHVARRFEREAQVTTRLAHPNIVEIVEFGAADGQLFLAMEFLEGRSLADLIEPSDPARRERLSIERTLAIMRQVLLALEHAHSRGVVHRDLKPDNIMLLTPRGLFTRERVKLLDFGIAKPGDFGDGSQKLTQAGLALGTPRYMSPEQAMARETDARSDLYSCGVILYELLTGRPPFESESMTEVLSMHLTTPPRPLRMVAPGARIPAALEAIVLRALAKEPAQRFQSARELCDALERAPRFGDNDGVINRFTPTVLAAAPAPVSKPSTAMRLLRVALVMLASGLLIADCQMLGRETLAVAHVLETQDPPRPPVRVAVEPARNHRPEPHGPKPKRR